MEGTMAHMRGMVQVRIFGVRGRVVGHGVRPVLDDANAVCRVHLEVTANPAFPGLVLDHGGFVAE